MEADCFRRCVRQDTYPLFSPTNIDYPCRQCGKYLPCGLTPPWMPLRVSRFDFPSFCQLIKDNHLICDVIPVQLDTLQKAPHAH